VSHCASSARNVAPFGQAGLNQRSGGKKRLKSAERGDFACPNTSFGSGFLTCAERDETTAVAPEKSAEGESASHLCGLAIEVYS
jgi:hypothetical protein